MLGDKVRVHRARVVAALCLALGFSALIVAPIARSQTKVGSAEAGAGTFAVASSNGEQPTPHAAGLPERPEWVEAENAAGKAFVYPPQPLQPAVARPVTVLLHGMCGEPQSACGPFVDVATSRGWLVCPKAEDACGGGTSWRLYGHDDAKLVEASVQAIDGEHHGAVDLAAPRVLVGFSLGGIAAVQIAQAGTGNYAGLVVIASQVHPDVAQLKKAGIKRVVLAAGDLDMTSAPLRKDARRLEAHGVPTRFVSLGRFGHGYPADMQERMREPMRWVAGDS
jgi:predicted esterase